MRVEQLEKIKKTITTIKDINYTIDYYNNNVFNGYSITGLNMKDFKTLYVVKLIDEINSNAVSYDYNEYLEIVDVSINIDDDSSENTLKIILDFLKKVKSIFNTNNMNYLEYKKVLDYFFNRIS